MAQFVLVNVVVAVLMKHLEDSNKSMMDDLELDEELEREIYREQVREEEQALCMKLNKEKIIKRPLQKVSSLPSNFTFSSTTPTVEKKFNASRRQTVQCFNQNMLSGSQTPSNTISESAENALNEAKGRYMAKSRIGNRRMLNKLKTQSFDHTYMAAAEPPNIEELKVLDNLVVDNSFKIGQSIVEPTAVPSAGQSLASKKPINLITNRKINFRQSSLDIDNRRNAPQGSLLGNKSYLSVPKLQAANRSRSGSTKMLFKQMALDEDATDNINESSLLLPNATPSTSTTVPTTLSIPSLSISSQLSNPSPSIQPISIISTSISGKPATLTVEVADPFKKSESCELLRIISERRKM